MAEGLGMGVMRLLARDDTSSMRHVRPDSMYARAAEQLPAEATECPFTIVPWLPRPKSAGKARRRR